MVAWWLRAMAAVSVLVLVVWLAWAWPQSTAWALAGLLGWLLAGRLWLALQFVCSTAVSRSVGEPPVPASTIVQAWNAEARLAGRAFAWEMPWAEHEQADYLPQSAPAPAGVLLVHGWMCNRAMWSEALYQLRLAGVPCVAVSMPMLLHRIGTGRARLDAAAQRLAQCTGRRPVVVAHSMGGLVVRDWLRSLPDADAAHRPHAVVTVGSPHHGAWTATLAMGANVAQMRPGSAWLQQLQADEARAGSAMQRVAWHCAVSDVDNMVFPTRAAILQESNVLWLRGFAHVQMLHAPALWALVHELVVQAPATASVPAAQGSALQNEAAVAHAAPNSII